MKLYKVGGCVRDKILGLEAKDIDYVVVGSSVKEMLDLGYIQVGKDFPVFLKNNQEYALARIDRKTGTGYGGFTVESNGVTLEEDLGRRDLTINAMAMDDYGNIIDPYNGQDDLKNKIIRHVSNNFSEDPLRVLRAARFASRYGFNIAKETAQLMIDLGNTGELDTLVKERVWLETTKVFNDESNPSFYFKVLEDTNNLERIYKVKTVDYSKLNQIYKAKDLTKEEKFNLYFLVVYSDQNTLKSIDDFDKNETKVSEKEINNTKLYYPSSLKKLKTQFELIIKFGVYYGKSDKDRLSLIKQLRVNQNQKDIEFLYNTISSFTKNEILIDEIQRSKEVFLNDINELSKIDYAGISKSVDPKDISKILEKEQLLVLSKESKSTIALYQKDIKYKKYVS